MKKRNKRSYKEFTKLLSKLQDFFAQRFKSFEPKIVLSNNPANIPPPIVVAHSSAAIYVNENRLPLSLDYMLLRRQGDIYIVEKDNQVIYYSYSIGDAIRTMYSLFNAEIDRNNHLLPKKPHAVDLVDEFF
jgi:hypothetical protein